MESLELRGYWWLPHWDEKEVEERKVAGVLSFSSQNGGRLERFDLLESRTWGASVDGDEREVIHGKTTKDEAVTLFDCYRTNRSGHHSARGITGAETYLVQNIVKDSPEDGPSPLYFDIEPEFNEYRIEFKFLKEWCGHQDDPYFVDVGDASISLLHTSSYHSSLIEDRIEKGSYFSVQSGSEITITDFYSKYLVPLRDFISFSINSPTKEVAIYGIRNKSSSSSTASLYHRVPYESLVPDSWNRATGNFLLKNVRDNFGELLHAWFDINEKFGSLLNFYISTRFYDDTYPSTVFLNNIRIIDGLHFILHSYTGRGPPLRRKLNDILEGYQTEINSSLPQSLAISDVDETAKGIKNTRIELAHPTDVGFSSYLDNVIRYNKILRVAIAIVILDLNELPLDYISNGAWVG